MEKANKICEAIDWCNEMLTACDCRKAPDAIARARMALTTIISILSAYRKPTKPDCSTAEWNGGKCCGYCKGENDDEPIDACKACPKQASYGEE